MLFAFNSRFFDGIAFAHGVFGITIEVSYNSIFFAHNRVYCGSPKATGLGLKIIKIYIHLFVCHRHLLNRLYTFYGNFHNVL